MFRRLGRHIKEGFIGIKRHFSMAISSIASVTITLLLIGLFLVLTFNISALTKEVENSISISALVSYDSEDQMDIIEEHIKTLNGVKSVTFQSKDDEFTFYVSQYPDLSDFYELYREDNPFHDAFMVEVNSGEDIANVKNELQKINGIDSVHDGGTNTYLLVDALTKIRLFGGLLVLGLTVLAVYLIYNTIHITIESRETEIWIMRNVGARNGYIRAPFLVEGILIGIFGSILPILIVVVSYLFIYSNANGVVLGVLELLQPSPFLVYVSLLLVGLGIIVGFIGSYFSVTKTLWRTR